jgi:hypothetical protein
MSATTPFYAHRLSFDGFEFLNEAISYRDQFATA